MYVFFFKIFREICLRVLSALTIFMCSRVPYFGIVVGLIILFCRDIVSEIINCFFFFFVFFTLTMLVAKLELSFFCV